MDGEALMDTHAFSGLTPVAFLQTFVSEVVKLSSALDGGRNRFIEQLGFGAGSCFEAAYRAEFGLLETLSPEQYADLIVRIKNKIGGNFSLASSTGHCIKVLNTRCPFGLNVRNAPGLCQMTSSVFGGIAARNFGYAKVELAKRIAAGDNCCEVLIHTDPAQAAGRPGDEYRRGDPKVLAAAVPDETPGRVERRLQELWCAAAADRSSRSKRKDQLQIVARSEAMRQALTAVETVAPTTAALLITGETGVGKELIARAVHALSERWNKPFVAVNCGAIPEGLLESALFGHERGAFTGAHEVRHGYFERAEGGTLFLDEIDTLSPAAQTRLLRVLQEEEYERVGGRHTLSADVRIVAATNSPLDQRTRQGAFRRDLYYRINVVNLWIPPLRERPEDLPALVEHILQRLSRRYGRHVHSVTPSAMSRLVGHAWPGNIRELENVLERSFLFSKGDIIERLMMSEEAPTGGGEASPTAGKSWRSYSREAAQEVERTFLVAALRRLGGDVGKVAECMEVTRRSVFMKMRRHGLRVADFRVPPHAGAGG